MGALPRWLRHFMCSAGGSSTNSCHPDVLYVDDTKWICWYGSILPWKNHSGDNGNHLRRASSSSRQREGKWSFGNAVPRRRRRQRNPASAFSCGQCAARASFSDRGVIGRRSTNVWRLPVKRRRIMSMFVDRPEAEHQRPSTFRCQAIPHADLHHSTHKVSFRRRMRLSYLGWQSKSRG